jgi:hypothetical protein
MIGNGIDRSMVVTAGAVDRRLETKGGDFSECREWQRTKHPARLEPADGQRRVNFLPSALASVQLMTLVEAQAPK